MSTLTAFYLSNKSPRDNFRYFFWYAFRGWYRKEWDQPHSDYWLPSILGFLELASYPPLIATGQWTIIGAWIAFKTVAQWRTWNEDRITFNRYLIGNALIVLFSFLSALFFLPYVKSGVQL